MFIPLLLGKPKHNGTQPAGLFGIVSAPPLYTPPFPFSFFFSISLPVVCTLQERDGKELLSRCSRPSSVKCLGLHTARGSFAVFNSAMFHRWNMCVTYTIDVRFLWALGFSSFFLVAEAIDSLCVCVWLHLYTRECRTPFTVAHTWTLDGASRLRDVGRQVLTQSAARVSSFSLVFLFNFNFRSCRMVLFTTRSFPFGSFIRIVFSDVHLRWHRKRVDRVRTFYGRSMKDLHAR